MPPLTCLPAATTPTLILPLSAPILPPPHPQPNSPPLVVAGHPSEALVVPLHALSLQSQCRQSGSSTGGMLVRLGVLIIWLISSSFCSWIGGREILICCLWVKNRHADVLNLFSPDVLPKRQVMQIQHKRYPVFFFGWCFRLCSCKWFNTSYGVLKCLLFGGFPNKQLYLHLIHSLGKRQMINQLKIIYSVDSPTSESFTALELQGPACKLCLGVWAPCQPFSYFLIFPCPRPLSKGKI